MIVYLNGKRYLFGPLSCIRYDNELIPLIRLQQSDDTLANFFGWTERSSRKCWKKRFVGDFSVSTGLSKCIVKRHKINKDMKIYQKSQFVEEEKKPSNVTKQLNK